MSDQSEFDIPAEISALSDERRLRFYEILAHNLTISISVVWDDCDRSDEE